MNLYFLLLNAFICYTIHFFPFVFTDCEIGKVEQTVLEGKLSISLYNTTIPTITKTPLRNFLGFRIIFESINNEPRVWFI
jgi:hypothetical protein